MKNIKSAAIIGAGALGLLYADSVTSRPETECYFLADSSRADRLKNSRFRVNGREAAFRVKSVEKLEKKPDLIIVAVKNQHLEDISPLLRTAAGRETIIISVLNGIDSEGFLEKTCPDSTVIHTVAVGMDAVREDTNISYSSMGKLLIGTGNNDKKDPELLRLSRFLESCGIPYEIPDDIQRSLWWKWMINIGVNQVSAVTGANYGVFHTNKDIQQLMDSAMMETVRVARASGIDLRDEDVPNWYKILYSLGADGKTSMLQDIEARRRTEADWFSGRLISLAYDLGIPVPVNQTLYRILKTKEAMFL